MEGKMASKWQIRRKEFVNGALDNETVLPKTCTTMRDCVDYVLRTDWAAIELNWFYNFNKHDSYDFLYRRDYQSKTEVQYWFERVY